ncbi:MAG: Molybdopterin molybdenumtransferase [Hyphomicrobiaceae bacterium hypho_1]
MIDVEQALKRITANVKTVQQEYISLLKADRRILAKHLFARITKPPFDVSAMDGYAVRATDITNLPTSMKVIGESLAGHAFNGKIGVGEAVRIFTGAPMPQGSDSVILQENTTLIDKTLVSIKDDQPEIKYVRSQGMDFKKGDRLILAGHRLTPWSITLAAAMGYANIPVRRKPTVAMLANGNELILPGQPTEENKIICSNPFGIASIIERTGGQAKFLGIADDCRSHLAKLCATGLQYDILVTIGGISFGDYDLVVDVLKSQGMSLVLRQVAMRPGKPMMFGTFKNTYVIGLPGNPVSALICARVFLVPLIEAMLGHQYQAASLQTAITTTPLPENGPLQRYMRAITKANSSGELYVTVFKSQDSSELSQFASSNVLVVRAPYTPALDAGKRVRIMPLDF